MPDNTEEYILLIKAEMDESVRTALNGFAQASKELTDQAKNIHQSLKEVGENGGQGIEEVEKEVKKLTQATRQLNGPLQTASRTAKENQTSMDQWKNSLARAEQELREIPTRVAFLNNELKKLKLNAKDNASIINLYSNELEKLQAKQLGTGAAVEQSGKGLARFRQLAQNTAYQVTDFGVSIQNGTRASVAFTQQVPQVLGAFGAIGAVAGLAATAVGIFAGKYIDELQKSISPTAGLKRSTKELDDALVGIGETFDKIDLSSYIDQLKEVDDIQNRISEDITANSLENAIKASEGKVKALTSLVKGEANSLAKEYQTILGGLFGRDAGISELVLGLKISGKEAQALLDIINDIDVQTNAEFLAGSLDKANPKFKELRSRLNEINEATQQQQHLQEKLTQTRELALQGRIGQEKLLSVLAVEEADADAKKLIQQDLLNQSYDEYLKQNYLKLGLDEQQLEKLLRIKEENKEINKLIKDSTSSYQKLVESNETAEEERKRELKDLRELQSTLQKLKTDGKIDFDIDPKAFERAEKSIQKAFDERKLKEYKESLDDVQKIFYKLSEDSEKTQKALSKLDDVRSTGTFEEYAALVKYLGDAAPLADQLKIKMVEIIEQGQEQDEINQKIKEMADLYGLTEKQVIALQKAFGISAKDMKKELTEMQKILNDVSEKAVGHMTDAFIEFAKTGKASFRDMINSILEDTARLFVSQQFRKLFSDIGLITDPNNASSSGDTGSASFITQGFDYLKSLGGKLFGGNVESSVPLTNAYTSSASSSIADNVAVNIINNSGNETTTTQRRSSDGRTVDVMIESTIESAIARGRFDNTLSGQYGIQRRGT